MYHTNFNINKSSNPEAFITKNKSRIKIYNSKEIYLNDNDNFEIELFNPTHEKILSKIKLNNKLISSSGIIINPGQRVFLERYLDTNNKFLFKTYEVENTNESKEAIKFNGDVQIEFYNEQNQKITITSTGGTFTNPNGIFPNGYNDLIYRTHTLDLNNFDNSNVKCYCSNNCSNTIETGMIDKGEQSKQDFNYSNFVSNYFPFHTINYKILPYSNKQIDSRDIVVYCPNCGKKRQKDSWRFCPSCGFQL
jgi:predicted component of type VI protein secretion system